MVGYIEESIDRRQADEFRLGQVDAVFGGFGSDRLPDDPEWCRPEVEQVHRHLSPLQFLDPESVGLDSRQAATGLAYSARNPLGQLNVAAVEVDVVGDQEWTRPDGHCAGRCMHFGRAEIRLPARFPDLRPEALVLASPDICQTGPRRRSGGLAVEIDGD